MTSMTEKNNDVSIELTQKEFMRMLNMYKKGVKEYGLNKDVYDFDMFFCDVFALFLKTVKYGDVERVLNAAAKRVNVEEVLQDNELTCNDKATC